MKPRKLSTLSSSLLLVAQSAWAQGYYDHPHMWGGSWGWGHMIFGGIMMVLFWGGLVLLIVLAVRWIGSGSGGQSGTSAPPAKTALDILKERFARGEIDKDEFEERKRLLSD